MYPQLFVTKRFDWVEPRGLSRRVIAKKDPDCPGEQEAHGNRHGRQLRRPVRDDRYQHRNDNSCCNSGHSARDAQENRFGKELQQDMQIRRFVASCWALCAFAKLLLFLHFLFVALC